MRILSAPWCTSLASGVWLENARTANTRAKQLEAGIRETGIAEILYPVEANSVFLKFPDAIDRKVRDKGWIYYVFIGGGIREKRSSRP
jgi:threonine aldolase